MTAELSQFYQVFFDETAEHLANMESLLLALDVDAPQLEDLNAIFRAAHSMKGGSGTFGFNDMTEVTHELESLLDRLRKEELKLTPAMIDAFLRAGDVISAQLAAHRGDGAADPQDAVAIRAVLKTLAADPVASAAAAAPQSVQITIAAALTRARLEPVLTELAALGILQVVNEPPPQQGGPWQLMLNTVSTPEQIRERFEFVAAPADVTVEIAAATPVTADDPGYGFFTDPAPATDPGYGFFEPVNAVAATPAVDAGYGFFEPLPAPPAEKPAAPMRSAGRRAADDPQAPVVANGRRPGDKVAVSAQAEASSIRVNTEKVDQLINLVGELVITQAMLAQSAAALDPVICEKLLNGLGQLDRNTRDLQDAVMSIRMMPMSFVFSRFPRVVRDVAAKLGKEIELKTEGETTELDKGVIEKIADPLTHLVRNSVDHGIESPEVRIAAGKPAKGTLTLRAFHQGGNIIIEVVDDGAGLNRERILAKARERGMVVSDSMPDQDVWQLIFEAGFSTAAVVTDVSGRGVGMDVVKRNIRALGGRVEIDSATGVGTRIRVRLPLTLAILDGLSVNVGGELFIVPLTCVVESLQPRTEDVKTVSGRGRVVHVRGEYLPVVALHELFNIAPRISELHRGIVVIIEAEGRKIAMFVDALVGQHQVVIKSLETNYRRVHGISGATIMGDGTVALILDAVAIGQSAEPELAAA
jgi:two-component system chemotaxis sensor kinase CheA